MKQVVVVMLACLFSLQLQASIGTTDGGTEKFFKLVSVDEKFSEELKIEVVTEGEQTILLEILSETGRVMYSNRHMLYGELYRTIITEKYPKGAYKLKITCKDQVVVKALNKG
jgi:hypothetical protein